MHLSTQISTGNTRNFYEKLFSDDSSVTSSPLSQTPTTLLEHSPNVHISGLELVHDTESMNSSTAPSCSDMDISSGNSQSSNSNSETSYVSYTSCDSGNTQGIHVTKLQNTFSSSTPTDTGTQYDEDIITATSPVYTFLDEEEISTLLGENVTLPEPERKETLEERNIDIIASFNVRNKYDHSTAAELMLKEKLSFLAIQEPFASSHKVAESWKAYQKLELDSARITCFETPYQMILFDAWKWGGRVISQFQSLQYGRVASIAFDLGKGVQIGIVSIYAPTRNSTNIELLEDSSHPSMRITNNLVQKILSKWKKSFPNMATMVLGDFQETLSSSDRDNLGKFRLEPSQDGVVMGLNASHESVVRKMNPDTSYVTRFGEEGARGIDHIFFSSDEKFKNMCVDAKIQRDIGANYFPSDHSLITCSVVREEQNNNCSGHEKEKYDYDKIFSIKLTQSGLLGKDLDFDNSQFMNCKKVQEQLNLFKKIQLKTGDDAPRTTAFLTEIEDRVEALFRSLWHDGVSQQVDGSENKLVEISDAHAAEVSFILNSFNNAIKTVMMDLKLLQNKNNNDSAGKTRGRLIKRNGFKIFNNLPVPTKLRYVKKEIESKINQVQKNLYWLKEYKIRTLYESNSKSIMESDPFWKQWELILQSDTLLRKATAATTAYSEEDTERLLHTSAIRSAGNGKKGNNKRKLDKEHDKPVRGNTLPHVPDNVTRLLNFWLANSGCNQGFNASSTSGGSPAFLTEKILDWKKELIGLDASKTDFSSTHQFKETMLQLEKAKIELQKVSTQVTKLQTFYRQSTLEHFLSTSNISSFTRKVAPKGRQAPAAHTSIWDPSLQEFRTCLDEMEELRATSAFHGKWMANSAAHEICAFAKIRKVGRLGNRGVQLYPNRIVTMADVPLLIHNGASLPRKIKKTFIRAHGPHTANLFREPDKDNPEFYYPFYLLNEKGHIQNEHILEKNLWKAISSTPSKARFEGFQLAVVGRFGARWRNLLLQIIKLILTMRYVPTALKKMARFPIPKPGKHNEYRPISLCHDLYCYLMGIITSFSSAAIERAGTLHEGLSAYQKGKGCANLVTTELSFREDCLESDVPSVQIDEDEEKFFDRIPVEILLAAMRVNGFPNQGYIEIKASAMESKTVEIITAKGVTYARFICGLEQGNPDSPTVSNLVIKFKHDIWGSISSEIKSILKRNNTSDTEKYKFHSIDEKDGQVYLCKIGYSDDNSKYLSVRNEEDLLLLVRYFTQLSGDISMVTKIGRKSSKCEVQFYNISATLALKMEKVWSTAWSFLDDSPIQEQIPFRIHLKKNELEHFYQISDYFNLEEERKIHWDRILDNDAHRHLGLYSTLGADTSMAWRKNLQKMMEKLNVLKIHKMHLNAQRKCFNMLVGTIPTFVPIQTNFPGKELLQFDQHAAKICMKTNGLSRSDTKIRMFLPEKFGGLGLISTLELDVIAVAREFEIISNNITLDSRSFRTRIKALTNYPTDSIFHHKNHARETITKLARYGIYVRDTAASHINEVLAEMSTKNRWYRPFNHPDYKDSCRMGIGLGKERNVHLMHGGIVYSILQLLQNNNWKSSDFIDSIAKAQKISVTNLLSLHNKCIKRNQDQNILKYFSHWEWRNKTFKIIRDIPMDKSDWEYHNYNSRNNEVELSEFVSDPTYLNTHQSDCNGSLRFSWGKFVRICNKSKELSFNVYSWEGSFLKFLMGTQSPIVVATDGSHDKIGTTSSFVLCVLDIRQMETMQSGQWMNRPVIPILSRVSDLPQNFGSSQSDIAHGEFGAILMAELALANLPRITLSDSKAIRRQALKIRQLENLTNDRNYVRTIAGGVGKFMCGLFRDLLHRGKVSASDNTSAQPALRKINDILSSRNKIFLNIAKSWIAPLPFDDEGNLTGWEQEYFDEHPSNPILKINSHQLNDAGTHQKSPPRYKTLIPNLAVLNANHHADQCAGFTNNRGRDSFVFDRPPTFLRFSLVCGGKVIDRNISDFCHKEFSNLKVRKLRQKKTQGLLWRLLHLTSTSWEILLLYKGWLRSLLGLSSTHTRRTYKSEIYRECCKAKLLKNNNDDSFTQEICEAGPTKLIQLISGCMWCTDSNCRSYKGNRNHIFLQCNNPEITHFKTRVTNLIEAKFHLFFLELCKATNEINMEECIKKIEKTFLNLQDMQVGRLSKIPVHLNHRYISISNILCREGLQTMKEAINNRKSFNFFSELFGLSPSLNGTEIKDEEIGLVDCPWLGLTSTQVDSIMESTCDGVNKFISHEGTANALSQYLHQSWKEIKNLIMGKAIGIHRLIGSIGSKLEKEWKKEFHIDTNTIGKIKRESDPNSHTCFSTPLKLSRVKRKFDKNAEDMETNTKKLKPNVISPENFPKKLCTGITCSHRHKDWYPTSNFSPNTIKTSVNQCQRCSRYMTAVRQGLKIMSGIKTENSNENTNNLVTFVKENQHQVQYRYPLFFTQLNKCLPDDLKVHLEKKKRVKDRFKLICNILRIAITKSTRKFTINDIDMFRRAVCLLSNIISCKESDFNLDKEAEAKIRFLNTNNKVISCRKLDTEDSSLDEVTVNPKVGEASKALQPIKQTKNSIPEQTPLFTTKANPSLLPSTSNISSKHNKIPNIIITGEGKGIGKEKKPPSASKPSKPGIQVQDVSALAIANKLQHFASTIIRPNRCLGGDSVMKAVEILRSFKTSKVFIGSAESANLITSWQSNQGWKIFARIFGSRELISDKANGAYLIPIFSGDVSLGHWSLCVVQKLRQRDMKAWCLDSLGTGKVEQMLARKIENAFSPGRGRFQWIPCTCKRQEELECGPRTILAMWKVQQGIQENLPIDDCIRKATLLDEPSNLFTPDKVREKIAHFVNRFTPSMITPIIRLRQRNSINQTRRNSKTNINPIVLD